MKRMCAIATLFVAMLFMSGCSQGTQSNTSAQETGGTENIEKVLTDLSAQWVNVALTRDTSVLERILAPDLAYVADDPEQVSGGTTLSKQDLIEYDKTNSNKTSTAENRNVKFRVLANDFAVGTGDYHVTGFDQNGKEFNRFARWTTVWVRRNGSWQVVAGHNTWHPTKS